MQRIFVLQLSFSNSWRVTKPFRNSEGGRKCTERTLQVITFQEGNTDKHGGSQNTADGAKIV